MARVPPTPPNKEIRQDGIEIDGTDGIIFIIPLLLPSFTFSGRVHDSSAYPTKHGTLILYIMYPLQPLLYLFILLQICHIIGLHFSTKQIGLHSSKAMHLKELVKSCAQGATPMSTMGMITHPTLFVNIKMVNHVNSGLQVCFCSAPSIFVL